MNKKTGIVISSIALAIIVLSASTILYFRTVNAESPVVAPSDDFYIPTREELQQEEKESSEPISVPPITAMPKKAAEVIEEPTVSKPEDNVPAPEVTETTEPDGGIVQTPNWEAQKELAPDTDLENPDKQPEYVKPEQLQAASSKPAAPAPSSNKAESVSSKSAASASDSSKAESTSQKPTASEPSSSKADSVSSKPKAPASNSSKAESVSSKEPAASSKSSNTGSTPKNGDTKTENGKSYTYVKGFGWVQNGDGGTVTKEHAPTTGEKVGN